SSCAVLSWPYQWRCPAGTDNSRLKYGEMFPGRSVLKNSVVPMVCGQAPGKGALQLQGYLGRPAALTLPTHESLCVCPVVTDRANFERGWWGGSLYKRKPATGHHKPIEQGTAA